MDNQDFYDKRGQQAQESQQPPQINPCFMAPYRALYKKLQGKVVASAMTNHGEEGEKETHRPDRDKKLKLLDVGCGTGAHLLKAAQMGYECWGVDTSKESLAACQKFAHNTNLEVHLINGSFDHKDLDSIDFDVIMTSGTLYYLDRQNFRNFVLAHLRPGGTFYCVETVGDNFLLNTYRRWQNKRKNHRDKQTMENLLTRKDFILFAVGFHSHNFKYFGLMAPMTKPVKHKVQQMLLKIIDPLDSFLLNQLGNSFVAFKILATYEK